MAKTILLASLLVVASALKAPKTAAPAAKLLSAAPVAAANPLSKVVAAAAAATAGFAPYAAMAQSEGTGLMFGIDDQRLQLALVLGYGLMFSIYFNWAKDQPDSDSDFFGACLFFPHGVARRARRGRARAGEYDERRN